MLEDLGKDLANIAMAGVGAIAILTEKAVEVGKVCGAIMLAATVIYMILGFGSMALEGDYGGNWGWAWGWIVYPIAGVGYDHYWQKYRTYKSTANRIFLDLGFGGEYAINEAISITAEAKSQWMTNMSKGMLLVGCSYKF